MSAIGNVIIKGAAVGANEKPGFAAGGDIFYEKFPEIYSAVTEKQTYRTGEKIIVDIETNICSENIIVLRNQTGIVKTVKSKIRHGNKIIWQIEIVLTTASQTTLRFFAENADKIRSDECVELIITISK